MKFCIGKKINVSFLHNLEGFFKGIKLPGTPIPSFDNKALSDLYIGIA